LTCIIHIRHIQQADYSRLMLVLSYRLTLYVTCL